MYLKVLRIRKVHFYIIYLKIFKLTKYFCEEFRYNYQWQASKTMKNFIDKELNICFSFIFISRQPDGVTLVF